MRLRASIVLVHEDRLLTVYLRDPTTGELRHYLPGGKVEPGESPAFAAGREALEETGYEVKVQEGSRRTREYPFEWNGRLVQCRTHFFRARLKAAQRPPLPVRDAPYHEGVAWLPLDEVPHRMAYHDEIFEEIRALLPPRSLLQSP